jgi:O-antigen ligase
VALGGKVLGLLVLLAKWVPHWTVFRALAWGCIGAMVLALPLALDPVNVTGDPAISAKVLTLRIIEGLWGFALIGAWGAGAPVRWARLWGSPLAVATGGWILAEILSSLFSGRIGWTMAQTGHLLALPALVLGTVMLGMPRRSALMAVVAAAAVAGVLCGLYGFSVMTGRDPLKSVYPFVYATDDARNFLHSFLGNPEYFGGYAAALAAGAAGFVVYGRSWLVRLLAGGFGFFMVLCVVFSGTRAALLVLGVVSLGLLACRWPDLTRPVRLRILQVAGVLALLGAVGVTILSTENPLNRRGMRLAQRFASLGDPNSASVKERILFYAIAAETTARNPVLGSGPGSYQLEFYPRLLDMDERDERGVIARLMYDLRNRVAENAHSDWLQSWSEGGAVGGFAFAMLGAALAVQFVYRIRRWNGAHTQVGEEAARNGQADSDALLAAATATALCLYLNSAFSFPLHMSARSGVFWAAVAVIMALGLESARSTTLRR